MIRLTYKAGHLQCFAPGEPYTEFYFPNFRETYSCTIKRKEYRNLSIIYVTFPELFLSLFLTFKFSVSFLIAQPDLAPSSFLYLFQMADGVLYIV